MFEAPLNALEQIDQWLSGMLAGAPLLVALGIACLLGLRHASDPDHLVAVTSLAADDKDASGAVRLGAWWGLGHALTLLALGLPLLLLGSRLPAWLEGGAEKAVGIVIVVLAVRVLANRASEPAAMRPEKQLFAFSILYLFGLFGAIVADRLLLTAWLP